LGPLAIALFVTALSPLAQAEVPDRGLWSAEQILLEQVNTDRKAVFALNLDLAEEEAAILKELLPATKALRYAQFETRLRNLISRNVFSLIPLAR
jgi:hypothetical protein